MKYKSGYKYQLTEDEVFKAPFYPKIPIDTDYISLTSSGIMTLKRGFAWNGANFVIDRKSNMVASAFHDALYKLMRMRLLDHKEWRLADTVYAELQERDGACKISIMLDMLGLKIASGVCAKPKNRVVIYTAP